MAIRALTKSVCGTEKRTSVMYSLPIKATPAREEALDIRMMQLTAKAIEGW